MDKRMLAEFIELYTEAGHNAETARAKAMQAEKRMRKALKAYAKTCLRNDVDRLEHSLADRKRIHGVWDSWTEYGFLCGDYSDEEMQEFVDSIRIRPHYSAYDCTGEAFTICISWHRNPSGLISIVHHIGLDV